MKTLVALLLILAVGLAAAVIATRQHETQSTPLIQASCPRLENPCLKIDCRRPRKEIIA